MNLYPILLIILIILLILSAILIATSSFLLSYNDKKINNNLIKGGGYPEVITESNNWGLDGPSSDDILRTLDLPNSDNHEMLKYYQSINSILTDLSDDYTSNRVSPNEFFIYNPVASIWKLKKSDDISSLVSSMNEYIDEKQLIGYYYIAILYMLFKIENLDSIAGDSIIFSAIKNYAKFLNFLLKYFIIILDKNIANNEQSVNDGAIIDPTTMEEFNKRLYAKCYLQQGNALAVLKYLYIPNFISEIAKILLIENQIKDFNNHFSEFILMIKENREHHTKYIDLIIMLNKIVEKKVSETTFATTFATSFTTNGPKATLNSKSVDVTTDFDASSLSDSDSDSGSKISLTGHTTKMPKKSRLKIESEDISLTKANDPIQFTQSSNLSQQEPIINLEQSAVSLRQQGEEKQGEEKQEETRREEKQEENLRPMEKQQLIEMERASAIEQQQELICINATKLLMYSIDRIYSAVRSKPNLYTLNDIKSRLESIIKLLMPTKSSIGDIRDIIVKYCSKLDDNITEGVKSIASNNTISNISNNIIKYINDKIEYINSQIKDAESKKTPIPIILQEAEEEKESDEVFNSVLFEGADYVPNYKIREKYNAIMEQRRQQIKNPMRSEKSETKLKKFTPIDYTPSERKSARQQNKGFNNKFYDFKAKKEEKKEEKMQEKEIQESSSNHNSSPIMSTFNSNRHGPIPSISSKYQTPSPWA